MDSIIYFPYANTDPDNFIYRGQHKITVESFIGMEKREKHEFDGKIEYVMDPFNEIFGNNIAVNPFFGPNAEQDKRVIKVRTQKMVFACLRCRLINKNNKPMTFEELKEHVDNRDRFAMVLQLKEADLKFDPDLQIEIKSWVKESEQLWNVDPDILPVEQKLMHLPVKTLGIEVMEGEERMQLLFRECKVLQKKGAYTTLLLLVKRVDPYVDPDSRRVKRPNN